MSVGAASVDAAPVDSAAIPGTGTGGADAAFAAFALKLSVDVPTAEGCAGAIAADWFATGWFTTLGCGGKDFSA
jgi:hypothetical protein